MASSPDSEVIRTLAAILMADVANYGQLMGDGEPQTVGTIRSIGRPDKPEWADGGAASP